MEKTDNAATQKEITNFPCPVCGTHLEIRKGTMYVCPNCRHIEPINEEDDIDFSALDD